MKITFVLPRFARRPIGGYRVVYEYAGALADRGHQVTVVQPYFIPLGPPRSLFRKLLRPIFYSLVFQADKLWGLFVRDDLWWQPLDPRVRLTRVVKITDATIPDGDAIFATAWFTAEPLRDLPATKGQRFYLVQDFAPWLAPKDRLEATWRYPFRKVTVSRWLYDAVCGVIGTRNGDVINIANGIGNRFRFIRDLVDRPMRVAMLYGFSDYKGPRDGIRALEIAKQRHPELEVLVFGPYAHISGLPASFKYRCNVSEAELIEIYNSARIFVCSSIAEGFAFPPAEAMACGCAVAATDCGGIREYAEHQVTALLSPAGDPEALAQNIVRLLEDEKLQARLAAAGRERIREFTWERSARLLEGFIERSIGPASDSARHFDLAGRQ